MIFKTYSIYDNYQKKIKTDGFRGIDFKKIASTSCARNSIENNVKRITVASKYIKNDQEGRYLFWKLLLWIYYNTQFRYLFYLKREAFCKIFIKKSR